MRGQNNVQGVCDMGCLPNVYQGYQKVVDPEVKKKFEAAWGAPMSDKNGLFLVDFFNQAIEGKVKALYCMGMDVAYSIADSDRVQEGLRKMEFVIVQDIFLCGTAEFADVVLPGASFAEKDGTFTNLERRVQLIRKAIEPVGESKPDWLIICEIAKRMGAKGFDFNSPTEIMDEMPVSVATPEMRFQVDEVRKFAIVDEVRARLSADGARVDATDGVRVNTADGWWLLRASNTQDVLVARAEADDQGGLDRLVAQIDEQLAKSGVDRVEATH
jgi:anaerobic selenocysteine-containing dehydrogenase